MASLVVSGDTSGAITLSAPAVAGTNTLSLPAQTATLATLTTPSFATTIGVGGATPSASGAGITFPASVSASSDANTLDDYEEGDVALGATTTIQGGSGTVTINTGTSFIKYTKIGRQVTITGTLIVSSVSSPTGNITIRGLPFSAGTNSNSAVSIYSYGYAATMTTNVVGSMNTGAADITLQKTNGTGSVAVLSSDMQAGVNIIFSTSYFTN